MTAKPSLASALAPTFFIDSDSSAVESFVRANRGESSELNDQAVALYYAVRDGFRYDPYSVSNDAEAYKASFVLAQGRGWCVTKAILFAACCRAIGVPARLGFADVRNHLSTENMRKMMQTDVFYWHGYTSVFLSGKWVKATPAFNIELCEKFRLKPLEFDGREDSIYHAFDQDGHEHMEYLHERGVFDDLPLQQMLQDFDRYYPGMSGAGAGGDFESEVDQEASG